MMVHVRRQDEVTDHLPETIMTGRFEVVQDLLKTAKILPSASKKMTYPLSQFIAENAPVH